MAPSTLPGAVSPTQTRAWIPIGLGMSDGMRAALPVTGLFMRCCSLLAGCSAWREKSAGGGDGGGIVPGPGPGDEGDDLIAVGLTGAPPGHAPAGEHDPHGVAEPKDLGEVVADED